MPVPEGKITTGDIWKAEPPLPEEPTEVEEKEEEREDLAAYDAAIADPEPGIPLEEIDWKEE